MCLDPEQPQNGQDQEPMKKWAFRVPVAIKRMDTYTLKWRIGTELSRPLLKWKPTSENGVQRTAITIRHDRVHH